jgi:hypothetical protein
VLKSRNGDRPKNPHREKIFPRFSSEIRARMPGVLRFRDQNAQHPRKDRGARFLESVRTPRAAKAHGFAVGNATSSEKFRKVPIPRDHLNNPAQLRRTHVEAQHGATGRNNKKNGAAARRAQTSVPQRLEIDLKNARCAVLLRRAARHGSLEHATRFRDG